MAETIVESMIGVVEDSFGADGETEANLQRTLESMGLDLEELGLAVRHDFIEDIQAIVLLGPDGLIPIKMAAFAAGVRWARGQEEAA